ncbi:ABC transporter substrate-binding protein [Streptomyces sp. HC44]|uniref:ABC transporter substrate-binding protein n=1 Tax=Streptomyces scabichelini TaxID=2711217 RepID=A0A6G4UXT1_9ACTN|nr:ABC transporter substrate-binding protein [Streptomyces scabichelini]NGO06526.1 ABC transporter substrate-binding protein [Streptomyces scabichelini]
MRASTSSGRTPRRRLAAVALAASVSLIAACGGGSGTTSSDGTETITVALTGLGPEGKATEAAIKAFEKANPKIKVNVQVLSTDATQYQQQIQQRLVAGSGSPDVFKLDGIYAPAFAKSGWLLDLAKVKADTSRFMPTSLSAGEYEGKTYAVPWFVNTEGLFYRTDLVKTPPTTPDELVTAARQALKDDPKLKYGLAFEGAKYEGVITAFMAMAGGFGGKLDPENLDTPQNQQAIQFMDDLIRKYKIAPSAVTGWKEGEVQQAFNSGQAAFAINWPFVFSTAKGTPTEGKVGFMAFAGKGATLGAEMLAVNARSKHTTAAWKLIEYLTSKDVQITRALAAGNPPSVSAAYNAELFKDAPYLKEVEKVAKVAVQRPVSPNYPKVSDQLQTMLSSVVSGLTAPDKALSDAAPKVRDAANG